MSRAQPLIVQLYGNFNVDPRATVDDLFHFVLILTKGSACIFLFVFVRNLCEYLSYTILERTTNTNYLQWNGVLIYLKLLVFARKNFERISPNYVSAVKRIVKKSS